MKSQDMSKRQRGIQNLPIVKLVLMGSEGVGKSGTYIFFSLYIVLN